MKTVSDRLQALIFLSFIGVFFVLFVLMPDREFSEIENRALEQRPKLTAESLFSKRFPPAFESYTTDQFPFRERWISLKAYAEISAGKRENNGVYLVEGGVLLERFAAPTPERVAENIAAINSLADSVTVPVYLALIPSAVEILGDSLPYGAPNDSQLELIETVTRGTNTLPIDIYGELYAHRDEYIYYRTDHHWTSLGAYYGYQAIAKALGIESPAGVESGGGAESPAGVESGGGAESPAGVESGGGAESPAGVESGVPFDREVVSTDFFGSVYSSSGFTWVEPDSIEIFVKADDSVEVSRLSRGEMVDSDMYVDEYLQKKDKYSMFMGGNTGLLQISTGNGVSPGAGTSPPVPPTLLLVRDSYADSLMPFLLGDFSEIHAVDLRYFTQNLDEYIDKYQPDIIIVCYSVENFSIDTNFFKMIESSRGLSGN